MFPKFIENKQYLQLIHFFTIGITTNLSCYLVYLLVTTYGMHPKLAVVLLFVLGTSVGFHLNSKLTFATKSVDIRMIGKYFGISTSLMVGGQLAHLVLTDLVGIPHQITQAVSMLGFGFLSFFVNKKLTFR